MTSPKAVMLTAISRSSVLALLAAAFIVCCAVVARSQMPDQKLDIAVLLDAPNVPKIFVDPSGTLHFGPRTVPLPVLETGKPDKHEQTGEFLQSPPGMMISSERRSMCACVYQSL
jgi:hypothetical protein